MIIFITGCTGFIGSYVLRLALEQGHQIRALRRPGSVSTFDAHPAIQWINGSLATFHSHALTGCDAVLHLAAHGVSPQPTDWQTAFQINTTDSLRLVQCAIAENINHFVACGSCFEYGRSATRFSHIPHDAPLEPLGPYAASKAAFSLALSALARSSSISFSLLRPFHLYGDGQHESNFWPSLRKAARSGADFPMTAGEQVRDYQPVVETAAAFLAHLDEPPPRGALHVANLGSGQPVTLRAFAEYWWSHWQAEGRLLPGTVPYRNDEIMSYVPQI